ncbi:MAG: HAMP domain-containing sensor histidine kinase [Phycisphaeraceae bacterium]|nr:HAMP domain-containing sensor histidine kinase [Phycisphaeraceae bacterium]
MEQWKQAENLLQDLEELERKLEQMQKRIDRAHRLLTLGTMASAVAHEMNNILTPVISYCQLAQNSPEMTQKALDRALRGATQASQISQSMLGFARADESGQEADVREVFEQTLNCMAHESDRSGVKMVCQVGSDCTARINPTHLQQVIMNLILNAKAAMPGGGSIYITAYSNELYTHIDIRDSGSGIQDSLAGKIFEPFVSTDTNGGTGLGLCICRELIERAGGSIALTDTGPAGTTFGLCLPRGTMGRAPSPD